MKKHQTIARLIKLALAGGAAMIALQVFLPVANEPSQPIQLKISNLLHLKSASDKENVDAVINKNSPQENKVNDQAEMLQVPSLFVSQKEVASAKTKQLSTEVPTYEYTVTKDDLKKGGIIDKLFDEIGLSKTDKDNIFESDFNNLSLDNIEDGDVLRLWVKTDPKKGPALKKMEVEFNLADRALFTRNADNSFDYTDIHLPGEWRDTPISGEIHGSFSVSALKEGIPYTQADQIVRLLKTKLDFRRDLRAGDRFEVIQSKQYINDKPTGNSEIKAVRIYTRNKEVEIYQYTDGQFYDENGNSLDRAFNRYPANHSLAVTSKFNPYRRHPVTGRVSPHNGVDFRAKTGTPILATGDGVVTLATYHPYAGNYVVIQNSSKYKTRFMHMSKMLVKPGDSITRGQVIGLAGATGRVTGPHIHYEFMVNNKPVNPMTAEIPMAHEVPAKDKQAFKSRIAKIDNLFERQQQMLAQADTKKASKEDS